MKTIYIFALALVVLAFRPASATIINIPGDYPTIQEGIEASIDGDTVLVQPGIYVENINFNGHNIVLGSLFLTTGDTSYISATVIDGDSSGSVVVFETAEDSTAILTGFTIQNGYSSYYECGGICCYDNSSPTIANNIISGNSAYLSGGGIYSDDSSPTIRENLIINNAAFSEHDVEGCGGGITCAGNSSPIIADNIITENSAIWNGGGLQCIGASRPIIENNTISQNSAFQGGGIYCHDNSGPSIARNTVTLNSADIGGGIFCGGLSPIIEYNTIRQNSAQYGGAGIFFTAQDGIIKGNYIDENSGYHIGGGINCLHADPEIIDNVITDNQIGLYGGGIYCQYSNPVIHRNVIIGNTAFSGSEYWGYGGGISCHDDSNPEISNSLIACNSASEDGGGIFCRDSSPSIVNSTISGNSATISGGGIYCESFSSPVITNTIFWGDSAQHGLEVWFDTSSSPFIAYSDIQDTLWPGEGNIDLDPLFRDPESGDFHLMSTECGNSFDSPCIDAGDPTIFDSVLDCDWGLGGERSDMGAYGGQAIRTDIGRDHDVSVPMTFGLFQNYPNPFNARTTIRYALPEPSHVTINIYDLLGRTVETFIQGEQPAGNHQVVWDAKDVSSGMYFYRIQAGPYAEARKMLLLK